MKRSDGRKDDELRKINIHRNYIKHAEGSCLVEVGNTKVICTASIDKNVPPFLKNTGNGWVTSEYGMLPRATNTRVMRERNKVSGRTHEIQRLVGRALRSVVNTRLLGERTIYIDCDVIQADGGTRCASIVGGFIALVDAAKRLHKNGETAEMVVNNYLAAISVGVWKGQPVLDLCYEEDSSCDTDMNVVMKGNGEFIELQGTAEHGSFSEKDLHQLLALGKKGITEIIDIEKEIFKGIL
jgi:ribonuclease PH